MYCPNCSREASSEQKFCRSCGMELQAVADLISGQTNLSKPEGHAAGIFGGQQRAMLIWGMILLLGSGAVGASLKVLGKEHIQVAGDFTPYVTVIMLLIAFLGMGLMCYPFLRSRSPLASRKSSSWRPNQTVGLDPELLAAEPSSVTEQTTRFLETSEPQIKVRDTAPRSE